MPDARLALLPGIRQFDLHDRVAVITGGSKGLGAAMAAGLASAGAAVVLVGRDGELACRVAEGLAEGICDNSDRISW